MASQHPQSEERWGLRVTRLCCLPGWLASLSSSPSHTASRSPRAEKQGPSQWSNHRGTAQHCIHTLLQRWVALSSRVSESCTSEHTTLISDPHPGSAEQESVLIPSWSQEGKQTGNVMEGRRGRRWRRNVFRTGRLLLVLKPRGGLRNQKDVFPVVAVTHLDLSSLKLYACGVFVQLPPGLVLCSLDSTSNTDFLCLYLHWPAISSTGGTRSEGRSGKG